MEYVEHDLKSLSEKMKHPFSQTEIKFLMIQLLEGVRYLHDNWIMHRDLKPSKLLVARTFVGWEETMPLDHSRHVVIGMYNG
ncbi:hypothetical protein BC332_20378 [Capsicum chinense]|nr:hypothetical protein BC332_20378 [Capsicum chinense]